MRYRVYYNVVIDHWKGFDTQMEAFAHVRERIGAKLPVDCVKFLSPETKRWAVIDFS